MNTGECNYSNPSHLFSETILTKKFKNLKIDFANQEVFFQIRENPNPLQIPFLKESRTDLSTHTNEKSKEDENKFQHFLLPFLPQKDFHFRKKTEIPTHQKTSKRNYNENLGRGNTSYRKRIENLEIENNTMANLVFNRTHKLLMFGALGSVSEVVSDDEDGTTKPPLPETCFNPVGNVIDELAIEDNTTNRDIETMSKFTGQYLDEEKQNSINMRSNFLSKLYQTNEDLSRISMQVPIQLYSLESQFKFFPIDIVDFKLGSFILQELHIHSLVIGGPDTIGSVLKTYSLLLNRAMNFPNQQAHFVCSFIQLKFFFVTNLLLLNLSHGFKKYPYSLFSLLTYFCQKGFDLDYKSIQDEILILANQIDIGGLYCHELHDYQALCFSVFLDNFADNLNAQIAYIGSADEYQLAKVAYVNKDSDLYSIKFIFNKPRCFNLEVKKMDSNRIFKPPSIMPIYNMFDPQNKYASDTNEIIFLPW